MSRKDATAAASDGVPRSEAEVPPLAATVETLPLANRGVNYATGYLGRGGFDTLEVTLHGELTAKFEREWKGELLAAKKHAYETKGYDRKTIVIPPDVSGDRLKFFGHAFTVHEGSGRPYGQLLTDIKLYLGHNSWLHVASTPKNPERYGFARVELTEAYHEGSITGGLGIVASLLEGLGLIVTRDSVTRVDLAVNQPGAYVPELASKIYTAARGYLVKSPQKRVFGDPPETLYVGSCHETGYGYCIYHKISQQTQRYRDGKLTLDELLQALERYRVLGECNEVTRVELRLKGKRLVGFEECRTVAGVAARAPELFQKHGTESLCFLDRPRKGKREHQERIPMMPFWMDVLDAAASIPWDLANNSKPLHRVRKEAAKMSAEKYLQRGLKDLVRAAGFTGPAHESSLDVVAVIREMVTPEAVEGVQFRKLIFDALRKFAGPQELESLGLPSQMPLCDELGRYLGGQRVARTETLSADVRREAAEKVADLFSDVPF